MNVNCIANNSYLKVYSIVAICFFSFCTSSFGQTTYPLTSHPRLFFLQTDEAALKNKIANTPSFEKVHNLIIAESEKIINLPVSQRVLSGRRLLSVSREAIRRISFLSYAYRMTTDTKYAQRAEVEMLAVAAFTDWNPSHFLDVGEMTLAMAIGYDWCYNSLSQASRTKIATAIKAKGIERTTGSNANQGWLTSDNNWNQVCNAGISAGVAAVYDENPTYYQPLIDRAVNSIKIPMGVYKYNGAYPEGMGYWEYGTSFNILFIDLLQRMWNTDRALIGIDGFSKTVNFVTHMQGNGTKQISGGTLKSINPLPFNFADSGEGFGMQPGMFWLAARTSDPSVLFNEMKKLEFSLTNSASSLTGNRLLPFLLIWGMNLDLTNLQATTETTYIGQGKSAVAAMRSGWGPNDIYLAVKGGTPSASHAHMDIGSFVMEVNDIRWAEDFGMSSYNSLETNGVDLWNMSQTSERWDVFRLNNMAHNTLTFNGKKQLVSGDVAIENLINTNELKSVSMNLTPVYKNDVSNCRRTASIVSNRYVEIKDEIRAGSSSLTTRWNLLTRATPVKVSDKIIKLVQSTKTLYLILEGADDVKSKTWSTKPPTAYEEQNDGYFFAGFEFTIPAGSSKTITVKLVPAGDPLLDGLDLNSVGKLLNEDFETFNLGTSSAHFVNWKGNPFTTGSLKAVLGEVVVNPHQAGINTSEKVLRIKRPDDTEYITPANSGNFTYRGALAYGYDLRVNSNSVIEFKYYKDAPGKVGIRLYDGVNASPLMLDYTDPNETTNGYTTAQWRTARFAVGKLDYSKYNFTASGYLLISLERNGTEAYQEKELVMYVDDVKMLSVKASQTITFSALSSKTYGDAPFALSGTSSSGLPLTYASSNTSVTTVSGNMVSIVGAGTATITANQAGNNNYNPAVDVSRQLTVNKASQNITFAPLEAKTFGDVPFSLSASASSALLITYASSDPSVVAIDGNTVTILRAGTTTITARQAGNNNYLAPADKQQVLTINKALPSLSWPTPADIDFGTSLNSTQLNATSSISGSFTYVPTVGTKLNAGSGQQLLVTFVPTDAANYLSTTASVSINVTKAQQQITFPALPDKTIGAAAFNLTATASSSLPVGFSSTSDKISIANNQVTLLKSGRVSITANQVGNENFNVASSVTQSFCIKPAKPTVTISNLNTPTPLLTSNASSGNQWYADGTVIAGATSATFSATKSGSYKVQVTIDDCTGEFSEEQPLVITGIEAIDFPVHLYPNPVGDALIIYFGDLAGKKQVTIFALTGESLFSSNTESDFVAMDVANLTAGMYLARIVADGVVQTKKFKKQ
jgi:hypothetical protein